MNSVLLIFLDGVGIGEPDPSKNVFFKNQFKFISEHFSKIPSLESLTQKSGNKYLFPTDAILGVAGLPQSGTGQTSLFCGVNAQQIIGKHFGPYPYSTLLPVIKKENIFISLKSIGKKVKFANGYPKLFFDYLKRGRQRIGVTSHCCKLSDVRLNTSTDVWRGNAITAEINNLRWNQKLGYKLPVIKAETAARRLLKMTTENHFTLYEYFLTDYFGHGRIKEVMNYNLGILDKFITYIIKNIPDDVTLLICSDHGNLEDVSIKTHTLNPCFTMSVGKYAEMISKNVNDISGVKSAIMRLFS